MVGIEDAEGRTGKPNVPVMKVRMDGKVFRTGIYHPDGSRVVKIGEDRNPVTGDVMDGDVYAARWNRMLVPVKAVGGIMVPIVDLPPEQGTEAMRAYRLLAGQHYTKAAVTQTPQPAMPYRRDGLQQPEEPPRRRPTIW